MIDRVVAYPRENHCHDKVFMSRAYRDTHVLHAIKIIIHTLYTRYQRSNVRATANVHADFWDRYLRMISFYELS